MAPLCWCFTNILRALQNNIAKIHNARNHIYGKKFKLKLCMCVQSMALGTCTNFQLEIRIRSTVSAIHKFQEDVWRAHETLVKQLPGNTRSQGISSPGTDPVYTRYSIAMQEGLKCIHPTICLWFQNDFWSGKINKYCRPQVHDNNNTHSDDNFEKITSVCSPHNCVWKDNNGFLNGWGILINSLWPNNVVELNHH